jgi:hypothetical protein
MPRERRLLYTIHTIPAIAPSMQWKIIIYLYFDTISLSAAMSRGRRYTIPAITPWVQRKIIIYLLVGGHVWKRRLLYTGNHILHAAEIYHLFIWNLGTISLLAAMSRGAQVVLHHPGNHTLHAVENCHLCI